MTELNILKQTSITNIFLYRTVFNWGKENNARLVTDRQTDRQTDTNGAVCSALAQRCAVKSSWLNLSTVPAALAGVYHGNSPSSCWSTGAAAPRRGSFAPGGQVPDTGGESRRMRHHHSFSARQWRGPGWPAGHGTFPSAIYPQSAGLYRRRPQWRRSSVDSPEQRQ